MVQKLDPDPKQSSEEFERHPNELRDDHYLHWAMTLSVAAYGWKLHGFAAGIGILVAILAGIFATNIAMLRIIGSLRAVGCSRWGWTLGAFVLLAISAVKICKVGQPC